MPPPGWKIPPELTGIAVLALHNVAVHRFVPAPADAALNLVTAAGVTALARRAGCSSGDLGLAAGDAASGLRTGLGGAAVAGATVGLAAAVPATRRLFHDERLASAGRGEAAYDLWLRIPVATALAEEVLFRGALLALLRKSRSPAAAAAWTGLLFGAWHVLPTLDHYQANAAGALIADTAAGPGVAILITTAATAGAGTVFTWLRMRSGSVLAPALTHAALNAGAYVAGRRVTRGQKRRGAVVRSGGAPAS